ncbi:MAG: DUF1573 domain-containing protein [Deltaproteobacteria bacterium]
MIHFLSYLFFSLTISYSCKQGNEDAFSKAVTTDLSAEVQIPTKGGKVDQTKMAKIEFKELLFDFGKVKEGQVVEHSFKFKNTGSKDLLLLYHESACGCTVPDFSKDPYSPGKGGEITIKFDTKGKQLSQTKKIKIFSNTYPNMTELTLKGFVIPK